MCSVAAGIAPVYRSTDLQEPIVPATEVARLKRTELVDRRSTLLGVTQWPHIATYAGRKTTSLGVLLLISLAAAGSGVVQ